MIAHRATLDVSRALVRYLARLLRDERRLRGTPKDSRALTPFRQAVMVLCWFRGERDIPKLGRDHRVSRATAYRYIHEGDGRRSGVFGTQRSSHRAGAAHHRDLELLNAYL